MPVAQNVFPILGDITEDTTPPNEFDVIEQVPETGGGGGGGVPPPGSITDVELADNSVGTSELKDLSVTTPKLADEAVTPAKMAPGAAEGNLGYTPADVTGDHFTGPVRVPMLYISSFTEDIAQLATDGLGFYVWGDLETNQALKQIYGDAGRFEYSYKDDPKFYVNNAGDAWFKGIITAAGTNIANITADTVTAKHFWLDNAPAQSGMDYAAGLNSYWFDHVKSQRLIGSHGAAGFLRYDYDGVTKFNIDNPTGDAQFGGNLTIKQQISFPIITSLLKATVDGIGIYEVPNHNLVVSNLFGGQLLYSDGTDLFKVAKGTGNAALKGELTVLGGNAYVGAQVRIESVGDYNTFLLNKTDMTFMQYHNIAKNILWWINGVQVLNLSSAGDLAVTGGATFKNRIYIGTAPNQISVGVGATPFVMFQESKAFYIEGTPNDAGAFNINYNGVTNVSFPNVLTADAVINNAKLRIGTRAAFGNGSNSTYLVWDQSGAQNDYIEHTLGDNGSTNFYYKGAMKFYFMNNENRAWFAGQLNVVTEVVSPKITLGTSGFYILGTPTYGDLWFGAGNVDVLRCVFGPTGELCYFSNGGTKMFTIQNATGDIAILGNIKRGNAAVATEGWTSVRRSVGAGVGAWTNIGAFGITTAFMNIDITICDNTSGGGSTRKFNIPVGYDDMANAWLEIPPSVTLGGRGGIDWKLDFNANSGMLRVRNINAGAGPTTLDIFIHSTMLTFTPDATQGVGATVTGYHRASAPITTYPGNMGGLAQALINNGLRFPPTPSNNTDPNTLDDYEEGSWTPIMKVGNTICNMNSYVGIYTKVGRQVTINGTIYFSNANGGVGQVTITGLPFPMNGTWGGTVPATLASHPVGWQFVNVTPPVHANLNGDKIDFYHGPPAGAVVTCTEANCTPGMYYAFSATYMTP